MGYPAPVRRRVGRRAARPADRAQLHVGIVGQGAGAVYTLVVLGVGDQGSPDWHRSQGSDALVGRQSIIAAHLLPVWTNGRR
jgi:L-aminopeptidase/D-esterase-like protein